MSNVIARVTAGQLLSYTKRFVVPSGLSSTAYGVTACPPLPLRLKITTVYSSDGSGVSSLRSFSRISFGVPVTAADLTESSNCTAQS